MQLMHVVQPLHSKILTHEFLIIIDLSKHLTFLNIKVFLKIPHNC